MKLEATARRQARSPHINVSRVLSLRKALRRANRVDWARFLQRLGLHRASPVMQARTAPKALASSAVAPSIRILLSPGLVRLD